MDTPQHKIENGPAANGSPSTPGDSPRFSKMSKHAHSLPETEEGIENNKLESPLQTFFGTIPREIVCEVFSWLRPRDLVGLAEVNRELRSLLKSKESLPIWKLARERNWTVIPDCPTDMTELQWARLIFRLECTICGQEANEVEWAVRMRVCVQCWNNYFLFQDSYQRIIHDEGCYTCDGNVNEADLKELTRDYVQARMSLVPLCTARSSNETLRCPDLITFEPDVVKMSRMLKGYRTAMAAGESEEKMKQLLDVIRKRQEWVVYASEHAQLCREWDPPLASVELIEREEGRKRLIAHLTNLGYTEEDVEVALQDSQLDLTIGLDPATVHLNRTELESLVRAVRARKT